MPNTKAWDSWISALSNGARLQLVPDHRLEYELEQGQFNFYLAEIHGIWDHQSDRDGEDERVKLYDRLSRASFMKLALPETDNYFLDIGLVPYNKAYPGADIPFLTAIN